MKSWKPTVEQQQSWEEHGYYVERCALSTEIAAELRGIIKNQVLLPEPDGRPETDPMDPMGNSPAERSARFRKLSNFCITAPHIWHTVHCGEPILRMAKHHLGHDVIVKFNSVFVKPARTGSATPWHQDNGLWRDGETAPYNFWMALDPATKMNGCLQFAPGTHKGDIVQHVLYEDSIHGELPRNLVVDQIEQTGVHHVELEPTPHAGRSLKSRVAPRVPNIISIYARHRDGRYESQNMVYGGQQNRDQMAETFLLQVTEKIDSLPA